MLLLLWTVASVTAQQLGTAEQARAMQSAPEGSIVTIEYKLPKPGTTEPVPKQTLETRIGHQSCGVTYYK